MYELLLMQHIVNEPRTVLTSKLLVIISEMAVSTCNYTCIHMWIPHAHKCTHIHTNIHWIPLRLCNITLLSKSITSTKSNSPSLSAIQTSAHHLGVFTGVLVLLECWPIEGLSKHTRPMETESI